MSNTPVHIQKQTHTHTNKQNQTHGSTQHIRGEEIVDIKQIKWPCLFHEKQVLPIAVSPAFVLTHNLNLHTLV